MMKPILHKTPFKDLWVVGLVLCLGCSSRMLETSLYFGQSKPDGSIISEKEWMAFKENYISRVFKEGSSQTSISGTWYDTATHRLIAEPTYLVTYYYKSSKAVSAQIDSLRYYYKHMFNQQSVLRVDKKVKADF